MYFQQGWYLVIYEESDCQNGETEDVDLVVGEIITPQDIMDNYDVQEQQPLIKKKKKNPKTPISNFGTSLLKILENRQNVPENPEMYILMSPLPQIKSLTEDQKTQLTLSF